MVLAVIGPGAATDLLFHALEAVAVLVVIVLGLIWGLKLIGAVVPKSLNKTLDPVSSFIYITALLFALMSFLYILIDSDPTNKAIAVSVLVGSLAAIGIRVRINSKAVRPSARETETKQQDSVEDV